MSAELHILSTGYADERVASTVALILDEGRAVVVDLTLTGAPFPLTFTDGALATLGR